jgi:hypothetical protein
VLEFIAGTIVGILGIGVSVALGRGQAREARQRRSVDHFMRVRNWLKRNEESLTLVAQRHHADLLGPDRYTAGFCRPEWMLTSPLALDKVEFGLLPEPPDPPLHLDALRRHWPLDGTGRPLDRYHEAISAHDAPENWFNGTSYRLLGVAPTEAGGLRISVCPMRYWDGFDSWGGLIFEAADRYRRSAGKSIAGPYRRRLGDPFDLVGRHCAIGFSVLTVRCAPDGSTFFLHRRDERVASGNNVTGLVPAGEFQPSDDSGFSVETDLDLWRAMMREYAEEFLGLEEARLRRGAPIDYDRESPFRELQRAYRRGSIRPYLLDVRLDPVSWKAGIRIVCVFNARTFDRIFADMVSRNTEGMLELPSLHRRSTGPFHGWPLNEDTVNRYLADPTVTHGARTCVAKAWAHREALGLTTVPPSASTDP